jgi:beta-lactamase class D
MMKGVLAAWLLAGGCAAQAAEWHDSAAVAAAFADAGVQGTFVLYDVERDRYTVHDRARAGRRYVPASTYKIPNSLIALAVGSVESVDEVLPYGGKPARLKQWEQDMSLREAIKASNVPVYQELARRTGHARMREQLARIDYGNNDIGTVVDRFWLDGPLTISALEQARFLARLAQDRLPFPKEAMAAVREITLLERTPQYALHGKTGWSDAEGRDLGWWVGWVIKGGRVFAFALNLDIKSDADGPKRVAVGRASLKALGVLP